MEGGRDGGRDGRTDGWMDERMDGCRDGGRERGMDGWMEGGREGGRDGGMEVYVSMQALYACMYKYVCIHIYIYIYIFYYYIFLYIYLFAHTHTHTKSAYSIRYQPFVVSYYVCPLCKYAMTLNPIPLSTGLMFPVSVFIAGLRLQGLRRYAKVVRLPYEVDAIKRH